MELVKKLNVRETTVNADTDLENGVQMFVLMDYLPELYPDSCFYFDIKIQPFLDYLLEAGFTENQIIEMNNRMYGNFVDITFYKDKGLYVLEVGAR